MFPSRVLLIAAAAFAISAYPALAQQSAASQAASREVITVNAHAASTPFPHFWEEMFGSGRAHLVMRANYQSDLRLVKRVTDFRYVRFHAIFDDENGVYSENAEGRPVYNWTYVDRIYDALLANGVRPFVEISFMPRQLAAHRFPACRLRKVGRSDDRICAAPCRPLWHQ